MNDSTTAEKWGCDYDGTDYCIWDGQRTFALVEDQETANAIVLAHNATVERLQNDLKGMKQARDDYAQGFSDQSRLHGEFARKFEQSEQRLQKCEEALREIEELGWTRTEAHTAALAAQEIAREALAQPDKEQP